MVKVNFDAIQPSSIPPQDIHLDDKFRPIPRKRTDLSTFLIHLTRSQDKLSAPEVLEKILREGKLVAKNPYCLVKEALKNEKIRNEYSVVCFSEAPLDQIHSFIGESPGRGINFEPYGLVFSKEVISRKGGNPVLSWIPHIKRMAQIGFLG